MANKLFPNLPDEGFIRISQLIGAAGKTPILPISRPTIYNWVRDGKMPAPMKIGGMVCWPATQLRAWLEGLAEAVSK